MIVFANRSTNTSPVSYTHLLPIFYRFYDGNVPDVSTIRHTIADQALLNMKNVVLVADKGLSLIHI